MLTTVVVSLSASTIQVGQTVTATAAGLDQNGASVAVGTISWSTSSAAVASVGSGSGIVVGVGPGQTSIIANAGGKQGQQVVTVVAAPVASVTVAPSAGSVGVGRTVQLSATLKDASGNVLTNRVVTWSSANTAIAAVSTAGLVTGVAIGGPVAITARSENIDGSAQVTVAVPVASVTVTPPTSSNTAIFTGTAQQVAAVLRDANGAVLSGRAVLWASSSPNATIGQSSSGTIVLGVSAGPVTITASCEGISGFAQYTVVVPAAVATMAIVPSVASVSPGGTIQLTASPRDAAGNASIPPRLVTWTSSNTAVATVSSSGIVNSNIGTVTGVSLGTATVTATAEGVSATAQITVAACALPQAITNLRGTVFLSGGRRYIILLWDRVSDATSYLVEAGPTEGSTTVTGDTKSLTDPTNPGYFLEVPSSGTWHGRVRARNACGLGPPSIEFTAIVP